VEEMSKTNAVFFSWTQFFGNLTRTNFRKESFLQTLYEIGAKI